MSRQATICAAFLVVVANAGLLDAATPAADIASLRLPDRHPYLLITPAEVEKVRQRAGQSPAARKSFDALIEEARSTAAQPWGRLPDKGDTAHWNVAARLVRVGLGAVLADDPRLARWVRDGLVAYADLYPRLPWTRLRCRVFTQSSLYEAMWAAQIAEAYDLVADSGALSADDRRHVERDVLRPAAACFQVTDYERDPRISDLHYRCYNFQAWHIGALGLIGLAVRDTALVDYAVNSRYGFRHLVGHDVRDDGLFWERSVGYHHFVLAALLPWTEAMLRVGVNLYPLEVPNDTSVEPACHYPTDTSPRPKTLGLMFQTPFYLAFPDLGYPAPGDSDRGPLRPDWFTLVAWNRYHQPQAEWLLRRQTRPGTHVGFLHYYGYDYRYDDVRLDGVSPGWDRCDASYAVQATTITANDDGRSQSDRYLLARPAQHDFVLQWTLTRLTARKQDRAFVVFDANPHNPDARKFFSVAGLVSQTGRPYRFRLEVHGDQAVLACDGKTVSTRPTEAFAVGDWRWLLYDLPSPDEQQAIQNARATWQDQPVGNAGVFRQGCTLLPSSGLAVLRQHAGDFTADRQATCAALSYGPYGGGHGHPDKLNLVVYAQGRQWLPDFGSMPYETHWKREWTAHTVSHNTVVIDGVSQQPAGAQDHMWPVDDLETRVQGTLEKFDPAARRVAAACDTAYSGFALRRDVRLWRHAVVDRFAVEPQPSTGKPAEHQFDYVLHVDGRLTASSVPLAARPGPLGTRCGYQLLDQCQAGVIRAPAQFTFTAADQRLRVWVLPQAGPLDVIVAQGPTNSPDERQPALLLRQRGPRAVFRTLIEPMVGAGLDLATVVNAQ